MDLKPSSALERVPLEIAQHILTSIDDISSLVSTVLACPFLYHAFTSAEEYITRQVLFQHVNPALINDAVLAYDTSHRTFWSDVDVRQILSQYFDTDKPPFLAWKLSRAIPIAKLHNDIHYLATELASHAIAKIPASEEEPDSAHMPLSTNEITRIERTLYRFEIYCNVFGRYAQFTFIPGAEQRAVFFSKFAPWENEQLGCVHDYLAGAVKQVIKQVAKYDPNWVLFFYELGNGIDDGCIQHQLSLGVAHLRRLIEAYSYDIRHRLLFDSSNRNRNGHFLSIALRSSNDNFTSLKLSEFDPNDEQAFITRPLIPDQDRGPEAVWRWAHQSESCVSFSYSSSQIPLRELAYVMWDMKRLEAGGIFERPWEGLDPAHVDRDKSQTRSIEQAKIQKRAKNMARQRRFGSLYD